MTAKLHYALAVKEIQHCGYGVVCTFDINGVGLVGKQRKGLGFPYLPVVAQGRGVVGMGFSLDNIRQTESLCVLCVVPTRVHKTYMGYEFSRDVVAGKMYAVFIARNLFKHSRSNPLGSLAQVIAREHSVYICIVRRPEPFFNIHRIGIYNRHHCN